jgi:perosamine synthetase
MKPYIPVNTPLLAGNEKKYLSECIDTGWISSEGPFVSALEENFAKVVKRRFGIAVCNGSVALDLALKALDIGAGDEVILPSFTIVSCVLAVVRAGAIPVLVDSCEDTWNMDVTQVEAKITSKTKAIMAVHIYGLPLEIGPILALAQKYQLKVIEDAAQMHGQTYRGAPCGSFGDISTFSFYPNKLITTGEGGMVLTNDENIAEKCRHLRNLSHHPKQRFYHEELGWNFRMSNLQAAVGVAQLEKLDTFVAKKRKMGENYFALLNEESEQLQLPLPKTDYAENIYWVYGIVLKNEKAKASDMMTKLHEAGVGTRAFFYPMHLQPVFLKSGFFRNESYPVAQKLAEKGFYLPSGLGLTEDEITRVAQTLKTIIRQ